MQDESRIAADAPQVPVQVWDVPVRMFHWLIVALVLASWVTSEVGGSAMRYHMWIGYSILTLVVFRIAWGFVGSRHARFSDFVHGPLAVGRYLRGTSDEVSVGHNPAGGWNVLALLGSLAVQVGTGLFANDELAAEGPFAARVGNEWSELLSTLHRYNFYVLLALVALHLAAVLFYFFVKRENLVMPLITGRKQLPVTRAGEAQIASIWLAVAVLACVVGLVALVLKSG